MHSGVSNWMVWSILSCIVIHFLNVSKHGISVAFQEDDIEIVGYRHYNTKVFFYHSMWNTTNPMVSIQLICRVWSNNRVQNLLIPPENDDLKWQYNVTMVLDFRCDGRWSTKRGVRPTWRWSSILMTWWAICNFLIFLNVTGTSQHFLAVPSSNMQLISLASPTGKIIGFKMQISTGLQYKAVPGFGEFCSSYCLPLLPQLACSILATWERPYSGALYKKHEWEGKRP